MAFLFGYQMPDSTMHLSDLRPLTDRENARRRTPRSAAMLVESLHAVGAARSGVVDEDLRILAGNGTYEALAQAGIEKVRIVEADGNEWIVVQRKGLTEEQKKKLALYDNRTGELAMWDAEVILEQAKEIDLSGMWTEEELKELLNGVAGNNGAEDPGAQIDRAEELRKKWGTERGQLWQIGRHRLMCGDSTQAEDVERLMGGAVPHLTVTDPPYGVKYDPSWRQEAAKAGHLAYAERRVGKVVNDDKSDWSAAWKLVPGDVIYSWHPPGATSLIHAAALQDSGFVLRMQIIWAKSNFPIRRGDYHVQHEPCWYGVRKGKPSLRKDDRTQTTLWKINLDKNVEGGHSTQKPIECMARPIRNHEGDCYDPFIGSGTTMVAAEQLGRICYGMEISPAYVAVCLERLSQMAFEPQLVQGS